MTEALLRLYVRGTCAARHLAQRDARRGDAGDVNGYVFVTIMTAGIVMVLWVVARDRLSAVFSNAIDSVVTP